MNFVELCFEQLSICFVFVISCKYDILIIVMREYIFTIKKKQLIDSKLITGKERSFMAIRKKQEPSEYQKHCVKFRKKSNRHVVVFEADIKRR